MPKQILVAFTNPVDGREAEYNEWYDNRHLSDVCRLPGFVSARRYRLLEGESEHRYMAIYEMDSDDPKRDFGQLAATSGTDDMPMSGAMDSASASALLYEEIN
ncbi:MAG: hypothetical protein OXC05_08200 [Halieaceae bacterium]|nr:hypothetical protein [Halieaceae bacterium]